MPAKDYYLILGVPRNETAAGIRAAYRDLAKRRHPDVAGTTDSTHFRELVEAYEVLSDPGRRRRYNHDLEEEERTRTPRIARTEVAATAPRAASSERAVGLNIEVVLTPEEASRGGMLPVTVPVFAVCPACGGSGRDWLFPCFECGAEGLIERRQTIRVCIPPWVRPGTVIEFLPRGLQVHNFYLRVHVLVGEP